MKKIIILILISFLLGIFLLMHGGVSVAKEEIYYTLATGDSDIKVFLVSPMSHDTLFLVSERNGNQVFWNKKAQKKYSSIENLQFTADGKHIIYIARKENGKSVVVFDAKESNEYNEIEPSSLGYSKVTGVTFVAKKEYEGSTYFLTNHTNEREMSEFFLAGSTTVCNPNQTSCATVLKKHKTENSKTSELLEAKKNGNLEQKVYLSNKSLLIKDGKDIGIHKEYLGLKYSPNNTSFSYIVSDDTMMQVYRDSKLLFSHVLLSGDSEGYPLVYFSPDGRDMITYIYTKISLPRVDNISSRSEPIRKVYIYKNDTLIDEYDHDGLGHRNYFDYMGDRVIRSDDSKSYAYIGYKKDLGQYFVVKDGKIIEFSLFQGRGEAYFLSFIPGTSELSYFNRMQIKTDQKSGVSSYKESLLVGSAEKIISQGSFDKNSQKQIDQQFAYKYFYHSEKGKYYYLKYVVDNYLGKHGGYNKFLDENDQVVFSITGSVLPGVLQSKNREHISFVTLDDSSPADMGKNAKNKTLRSDFKNMGTYYELKNQLQGEMSFHYHIVYTPDSQAMYFVAKKNESDPLTIYKIHRTRSSIVSASSSDMSFNKKYGITNNLEKRRNIQDNLKKRFMK